MAPVLLLLTLRDVILALQLNFVPALLMTDGGPRQATTFLPLYVYRQAFRYFRLGYASAVSLTMFVVTGLAIYALYRVSKRWRAA
jgi:multiple sugar transport system permease protein